MNDSKIYSYINDNRLNIELLMHDYTNYIYTIIRNNYTNLSDEDAEEIVLDVFITLWNNQNKLDINKKMSSYIAGITRNLIKKKYRNIYNNDNIEDYEMLQDIENIELNFIKKDENIVINEEINKLKETDKDIFFMYYYEDMKIKDIANYYKVSENKIKLKLFRIRKKLNKNLKKRGYNIYEKR